MSTSWQPYVVTIAAGSYTELFTGIWHQFKKRLIGVHLSTCSTKFEPSKT